MPVISIVILQLKIKTLFLLQNLMFAGFAVKCFEMHLYLYRRTLLHCDKMLTNHKTTYINCISI